MNRRTDRGPLTALEVRRLRRAEAEAARVGTPLNAFLTLHPFMLAESPLDTGMFFRRKVIAWTGEWFAKNGHKWAAIYTRENYHGVNREHLHVVLHVPPGLYRQLERALTRRWAEPGVVELKRCHDRRGLFRYLVKQSVVTQQEAWELDISPERRSRYTGEPVAPVFGRRCGMTANLRRAVARAEQAAIAGWNCKQVRAGQ
jgi:hypothetical protein